jgi:hypothetical protein
MSRDSFLGLLLCLPVITACGSDGATTGDSGGSGPNAAGAGGNTVAPATCAPGPSYADASLPQVNVGPVVATVLDLDGSPVPDMPVTVCGVDLCSNLERTDEDGAVGVNLQSPVTKPAFKYGDGLTHAELALLFPPTTERLDLGTVYLPALPELGAPIEPGERAESGGATLTLAANGSLTLDAFEPYDTPEHRAFRAAELTPDRFPDGLGHGAALEVVFTLAPLGAVLCPAAALELPNSAGWDPGTQIEFLVQGFGVGVSEGDQPFAPYGEWQNVATGIVDDSSEHLVMTDGGLPIISNVGIRRL